MPFCGQDAPLICSTQQGLRLVDVAGMPDKGRAWLGAVSGWGSLRRSVALALTRSAAAILERQASELLIYRIPGDSVAPSWAPRNSNSLLAAQSLIFPTLAIHWALTSK